MDPRNENHRNYLIWNIDYLNMSAYIFTNPTQHYTHTFSPYSLRHFVFNLSVLFSLQIFDKLNGVPKGFTRVCSWGMVKLLLALVGRLFRNVYISPGEAKNLQSGKKQLLNEVWSSIVVCKVQAPQEMLQPLPAVCCNTNAQSFSMVKGILV